MKSPGKAVFAAGMVIAILALGLLLPALARVSNCGGNSAAMATCEQCTAGLLIALEDQGQDPNIFNLSPSNRAEVAKCASNHWIRDAGFYLRTNVNQKAQPREIVVVCDTPYNNVPQPNFWNGFRKHPAYAVGFSDCSGGLISPDDFAKLNLSNFVKAQELTAKNR